MTRESAASPPLVDLDSRARIHDLVVHFYREIAFDDLLGPVFAEVAEVDWATHVPRLIDYWCRVLLGQPGYEGFILGAHQQVHAQQALTPPLFDRWVALFHSSVDGGWQGPYAERAKAHAARLATVLARRVAGLDWPGPDTAGAAAALRPAVRCG